MSQNRCQFCHTDKNVVDATLFGKPYGKACEMCIRNHKLPPFVFQEARAEFPREQAKLKRERARLKMFDEIREVALKYDYRLSNCGILSPNKN